MTRADQVTLSRLILAPAAACAYLLLPTAGWACLWAAGLLCGLAELTDWLDGRIARARREVSDFGKLADPFCDVIYRSTMLFVLMLPVAWEGFPLPPGYAPPLGQLVFHLPERAEPVMGMLPWLPVLVMILREIVAGALRSMSATKGLVLAARSSGKLKAAMQGMTIIAVMALPVFTGGFGVWQAWTAYGLAWLCAILSLGSIAQYIWINRATLAVLLDRRPA